MMPLAETQRWMQDAVLGGGGDARAQIRDGNRLTADDRIGIYASGYRLRLIECLRGEYPMLAALAGPTAFELFALGYIAANPSRSYTLYDYGAGFGDYLEASRPPGPATAAEAIPAALARIERARAEAARARGTERDPPAEAPIDPFVSSLLGLGMGRAYRRPDSVRLLALAFDFAGTLAAFEAGDPLVLPAPTPSLIAVARADYRVGCHPLEPMQYDWLASLPDAGGPADARLAAWLPFALRRGIVTAARL